MLVVTSESDVCQLSRGTFASSTKYLRQSSWPYFAACTRSRALLHQISFFLRRNISRCLSDHRMLLVLPLLFPSFAKVSLCRKEIEDSRGVLQEQLVHDSFSSHGQPLEKQYFSISRLPLSAAAAIVIAFHSQCFTSLAHLSNSSLFVAATPEQNQA